MIYHYDKEDDPVERTNLTNSDYLDDRHGHPHHHYDLDKEGIETGDIIEGTDN